MSKPLLAKFAVLAAICVLAGVAMSFIFSFFALPDTALLWAIRGAVIALVIVAALYWLGLMGKSDN